MGLIRCEQCGYDVSTEATHCPHCNTPIVLFQLKDSLSRKKDELKSPAGKNPPITPDDNITKRKDPEPPVDKPKKTTPNIFDTIKSFKEKNIPPANSEPVPDTINKRDEKSKTEDMLKERAAPKKSGLKSPTYKKLADDTPVRFKEKSVTKPVEAPIKQKKETTFSTPPPEPLHKTTKTNKSFDSKFLFVLAMVILFSGIGIYVYNRSNSPTLTYDDQQEKSEHFNKNRQKIIDEINTQLNLNNYGNAQKIAREYLYINDAEISKMYVKARREFLMIELSKLRTDWDNYNLPESLPNDNAKLKLFIDIKQHYREKRRIYDELAKIEPDNKEYTEKYNYFSTRHNEIDTKFEELNKKRAAEQKRKQRIDSQFSRVDDSHINLEKFIKSIMKYPDSYTHIKSAYEDKGNFLVVATTYQGKDIYEQVVIKTVKARVGLDGKVLGIISEY